MNFTDHNRSQTYNPTHKEHNTMATLTINFFDANDNTVTFAAESGETFAQVLQHGDVQAWFESSNEYESGDDIKDYIIDINGADVAGNEDVIDLLLRAQVQDDDCISFDFTVDSDDEELDNAVNGNGEASGAEGVVIVSIAGGLQTARINVTNNVTTVRGVIFSDAVRARSGMSDAQLREATVIYKGRLLSSNDMDSIRVNDADIIELSPRVAATKG